MNGSPFRKRMTMEVLLQGAGHAARAVAELDAADAPSDFRVGKQTAAEPYELLLLGVGHYLRESGLPEDKREEQDGTDELLIGLVDLVRRAPGGTPDVVGLLNVLSKVAKPQRRATLDWWSIDYLDRLFQLHDDRVWFLDGTRMQQRSGDE